MISHQVDDILVVNNDKSKLLLIEFDLTITSEDIHDIISKSNKKDRNEQWKLVKHISPRGSKKDWAYIIKTAIANGYGVGIVSFNNYKHIVRRYIKNVIFKKKDLHLLEHIYIKCGLPKNYDPNTSNKNAYIQRAKKFFKFQGNNKDIIFVDNSPKNIKAAKNKGYQTILADNSDDENQFVNELILEVHSLDIDTFNQLIDYTPRYPMYNDPKDSAPSTTITIDMLNNTLEVIFREKWIISDDKFFIFSNPSTPEKIHKKCLKLIDFFKKLGIDVMEINKGKTIDLVNLDGTEHPVYLDLLDALTAQKIRVNASWYQDVIGIQQLKSMINILKEDENAVYYRCTQILLPLIEIYNHSYKESKHACTALAQAGRIRNGTDPKDRDGITKLPRDLLIHIAYVASGSLFSKNKEKVAETYDHCLKHKV